ncbi:MAG: hypothetical protein NT174_07300, partial [Actinobacteria bacterium]|nr:hypothetical protein [Actinomycetota bacterium]
MSAPRSFVLQGSKVSGTAPTYCSVITKSLLSHYRVITEPYLALADSLLRSTKRELANYFRSGPKGSVTAP